MALGLVPFILLNGELDALRARLLSPDQQWATFVVGSAVTGVFGFLLGIANILSIKVSSFSQELYPDLIVRRLLGDEPHLTYVLCRPYSFLFSSLSRIKENLIGGKKRHPDDARRLFLWGHYHYISSRRNYTHHWRNNVLYLDPVDFGTSFDKGR
jgi:hypothetical protein